MVVIVILGVLATTALPKFINLGADARIASVNHLAGALRSTANMVYARCLVSSDCDEQLSTDRATFDGITYWVNYGWLDAGNTLNDRQVDVHIHHDGFTPVLLGDSSSTRFDFDSAPNSATCSVHYRDVFYPGAGGNITIETDTNGC